MPALTAAPIRIVFCAPEHKSDVGDAIAGRLRDPYPALEIVCLLAHDDSGDALKQRFHREPRVSFQQLPPTTDAGARLSLVQSLARSARLLWQSGDDRFVYESLPDPRPGSIEPEDPVDYYVADESLPLPLAAPPEYILIGLTNRCHYRCFFCCAEKHRSDRLLRDVPIEKFYSLKSAIETAGLIDLSSPGEVLLYPHVREAMAFVAQHNRRKGFQFTTTGALLTEELIRPVAPRIDQVTISLNASNAETYRRDMGTPLWDRVLGNFRMARGVLGRDRLTVGFVAHGKNIDELPDLVRLAAELDVWHIRIAPFFVTKPEHIHQSLWFCKEKTRDRIEEARDLGRKYGVIVSNIQESVQSLSSTSGHACILPSWGAFIDRRGNVGACCYSEPHSMGNVYEGDTFEQVWNGKKYRALRKRLYFRHCRECPNLQSDMNRLDRHIATEALLDAHARLPRFTVTVQSPAGPEQVRAALAAMKKQTYSIWETIFIVDASAAPAAQAEAQRDSRVRCVADGSPAAQDLKTHLLSQAAQGLLCCLDPARPFAPDHLENLLKKNLRFQPPEPAGQSGKPMETHSCPPAADAVPTPKPELVLGLILATRMDRSYSHTFGPLGLGYLAASVREHLPGVKVVMRERVEDLLALKPDLIGISSQTENYGIAIEFARQVKRLLNIPVIIGGVHITMLSESFDDIFDVGVMGEGEVTLVELLQSYLTHRRFNPEALKSIRGLVFRDQGRLHRTEPRELIKDLDALAPPVLEELPYHQKSDMVCLVSARGCPYHCTFCISEKFSQRYRSLSSERVARDVEEWVKVKGVNHVVFYDDLLIANKRRVKELIACLREKDLLGKCTFACAVRANLIDEEMCRLLQELGVNAVGIGLESFSDRILNYFSKTGCTGAVNQRALDCLHRAGIRVNPCIIFGAPIETREDMLLTLRKVYKNVRDGKIYGPTWCTLIPYPGTKLWDYALGRGIVSLDMDWDKFATAMTSLYLCEQVPFAEFKELMTEWMTKISVLLKDRPGAGGTFVYPDPQVVARNAVRLADRIRERDMPEPGDDLILEFVRTQPARPANAPPPPPPVPDSPAEIRRQAADLCRRGQWMQAEPFYRRLTDLQPNQRDGWQGRIECARHLNHRVLENLIRNEALMLHPEWAGDFDAVPATALAAN